MLPQPHWQHSSEPYFASLCECWNLDVFNTSPLPSPSNWHLCWIPNLSMTPSFFSSIGLNFSFLSFLFVSLFHNWSFFSHFCFSFIGTHRSVHSPFPWIGPSPHDSVTCWWSFIFKNYLFLKALSDHLWPQMFLALAPVGPAHCIMMAYLHQSPATTPHNQEKYILETKMTSHLLITIT